MLRTPISASVFDCGAADELAIVAACRNYRG
jgi:hypothetical protein